MSQCTRIAGVSELPPPGHVREFIFRQHGVCVVNQDGRFSALSNVCPHKGGPLSEGSVEDGELVCPWHGWAFSIHDGRCSGHPSASVKVFRLVIRGEDVFLEP